MKEKLKLLIKKDISAEGEDGGKIKLKFRLKGKKKFIVIAAAVIVGATAVLKLRGGNEKNGGEAEYTEAQVERGNIESTLTGSGTLEPADAYTVTTLIQGDILESDFEEGDTVTKETVLFKVDSSDAEVNVEKAEISYSESQRNYERALENIDKLKISPKKEAVVTKIYVEAGDEVTAGTKIADVRNSSIMEITLPFLADEAAEFYIGQEATLTLESTFETIEGKIKSVNRYNDTISGNRIVNNVTIEVENPGALTDSHTATAAVGAALSTDSAAFEFSTNETLTADVNGEVVSVNVNEGDSVSPGTAIVTLSSDTVSDSLTSAENNLRNSETSLENQYDQLENYTITSPIDGTIVEKNHKAGDTIESGTTLCTIYDLSYLTVTFNVDELDVQSLEVGQKVEVTADAAEGVYSGEVTKVLIKGSTSGGVTTYPVTIRIDETEGLLPGMNVDLKITTSSAENVLMIPVSAVSRGNRVLVKSDGAKEDGLPDGFTYKEVTIGISNDDYIEIKEGLSEGDTIAYVKQAQNGNSESMMGDFGGGMPSGGGMPAGGGPSGGGMPGGGGMR